MPGSELRRAGGAHGHRQVIGDAHRARGGLQIDALLEGAQAQGVTFVARRQEFYEALTVEGGIRGLGVDAGVEFPR